MNRFKIYDLSFMVGLAFLSLPVMAQLDDARGTTASTAVQFLAEQGIVEGYEDGTFKPEQEINRAEFLKLVLEAADKNIEKCDGTTGYSDVKLTDWWADIVCTATVLEIVEGYPDGTFRPAENINLAEGSKIAAKVNELETEVTDSTEAWYQQFVRALQSNKVITSSLQKVSQDISRGEMAQMVWGLSTGNEVNEEAVETLPKMASCEALGTEIERFQKRQGGSRRYMDDMMIMPAMMEMEAILSDDGAMAESVAAPVAASRGTSNTTAKTADRYSETNV